MDAMSEKRERGLKRLPDGRWQWSFTDPGGKYHRHIARTKTEARGFLEKARTDIREGRFMDRKKEYRATFEEGAKEFLKWSEANRRPATFNGDRSLVLVWLASPHFAGKSLSKITLADVERFREELTKSLQRKKVGHVQQLPNGRWRAGWLEAGCQRRPSFATEAEACAVLERVKQARLQEGRAAETPLTKRSIDCHLARLKRLFAVCVDRGLCETNPAGKAKLFRQDTHRVRYFTDDEEVRILSALPTKYVRMALFALHTGARKGELLSMRWDEVDLRNAVIVMQAEKVKGKHIRKVYLDKVALTILDELPRPLDRTAYVFGNGTEGPKAMLYRHWQRAIALSGVKDAHFHDLRHTFASRLAMAGVDLYTIKELMGHESIVMTQRYAHLQPNRLKAALAVLDGSNLHQTCNPVPPNQIAPEATGGK